MMKEVAVESRVIETRTAYISIQNSGIVRVQIKDYVELSLEDLLENEVAFVALSQGKKRPFLTIPSKHAIYPTEVRERFADLSRSSVKLAEAIVAKALVPKLIANFHVQFHQPAWPIRIFDNEQEALSWLEENYC